MNIEVKMFGKKFIRNLLNNGYIVFSLFLVTIFVFSFIPNNFLNAKNNRNETYKQLSLFGDVFQRVQEQYVEEVEDKELIEAAISGMLQSLDPHSSYLSADDYSEMQVKTKGTFGGLGIEITLENGVVKVVSPIDDTPAHKAGMLPGDLIIGIEGKSIRGLPLSKAVEKLRGKVGSKVKITILREGSDPFELEIIRDIIKIRSVKYNIINNVGYIRLTTFSETTTSTMLDAIEKIKTQTGKNFQGLILDLRNNPGGLLNQSIAVTDAFLENGEIVSTKGRNKDDTSRTFAQPGDVISNQPLIVLINSGSASASEIVAGALKDHGRAIILGTRSFGKGSVQSIVPIPGNGAIRLTTSRYYTPSGISIQAKGIEPDIIVETGFTKEKESEQTNIREENLKGALDNTNINEKDKNNVSSKKNEVLKLLEDNQISRAVDLIRGIKLYGTKKIFLHKRMVNEGNLLKKVS
tara:strand:+ start:1740 stop:3134 length:1395 start_codon:yes stop_codon:yes gene_type:complete